MISPREAALLHASATIYAGVVASDSFEGVSPEDARAACVSDAYALLGLITAREKGNLTPRNQEDTDDAA